MNTILQTDRLLIREFVLDDAPAFYRLVTDPEVIRYTGDVCHSLDEARQGLQERVFADYAQRGFGRWAAVYKPTGEVIGFAGLKHLADVGEVDLGYRFFKDYWGQGLATEASRAILAYGFDRLGLQRIIGIADIDNRASIRVLEKAGFRLEKSGVYRDHQVVWFSIER